MDEPGDGDERSVLLGWLAYHRAALAAKCAGLGAGELVDASSPPSKLTLLGLVRHLTEMERVYGVSALGPAGKLTFVYGNARHNGHADLLRERIDGMTGEN